MEVEASDNGIPPETARSRITVTVIVSGILVVVIVVVSLYSQNLLMHLAVGMGNRWLHNGLVT